MPSAFLSGEIVICVGNAAMTCGPGGSVARARARPGVSTLSRDWPQLRSSERPRRARCESLCHPRRNRDVLRHQTGSSAIVISSRRRRELMSPARSEPNDASASALMAPARTATPNSPSARHWRRSSVAMHARMPRHRGLHHAPGCALVDRGDRADGPWGLSGGG